MKLGNFISMQQLDNFSLFFPSPLSNPLRSSIPFSINTSILNLKNVNVGKSETKKKRKKKLDPLIAGCFPIDKLTRVPSDPEQQ